MNECLKNQNGELVDPKIPHLEKHIVTNDNGTAIKYANGMMICIGEKPFSSISMVNFGSVSGLYRSVSVGFDDFPESFIDVPNISYSIKNLTGFSGAFFLGNVYLATKSNAGNVSIIKESSDKPSGTFQYIAIGKWK